MIYTLDKLDNLKRGSSELFLIDSRVNGNPPATPTVVGDEILLPELSALKPIREIVAYDGTNGLLIEGLPAVPAVPSTANIAHWWLTLREQDGTFICDKLPLRVLDTNAIVNPWRRYWSGLMLPDPRQSFVETNLEGTPNTLVLEFIYAR